VKNKISSILYAKTGFQIDPFRIALSLFPAPGLVLTDFSFTPHQRMKIEIDQLKFDMDLKNFLHGRIVLGEIIILNPKVSFLSQDSQQPVATLPEFNTHELKKEANRFFSFLPEHQDYLTLTVENVVSPYFNRMDGSFTLSRSLKDIIVNANIKGLALKTSDVSKFFVNQSIDLDSIMFDQVTVNAKIGSDFKMHGNLNSQGIVIRSENKDLIFDTKTLNGFFKLSDQGYQLDLDPFQIDYPKGLVSIHFFSDLEWKKSEIYFSGNEIYIDQAKEMSLAVFKNNGFVDDLFDILRKGISQEIIVSFQADDLTHLFNEKNLNLKGKIKNGEVKIPGTELIASNVDGNAEIHKGMLDIHTTRGMIENSLINQGQLSIDLLGFKHIPFHGDFLLDVDLSKLPDTLASLLPGTLLAKELVKVHNVIGRSDVQLSLSTPTDSIDLSVKIDSDDFSIKGSYDRIPELCI